MNNFDMNTMSVAFLSVGTATDTTVEAGKKFSQYIGVGQVKVLAINPNAAKMEELMGFKPQSEPEYTGVDQNGNKTARVTFIVQTNPDKCDGVDVKGFLSFNLTATPVQGSTSGKFQVADEYSDSYNCVNTAWGEPDVVNNAKPIIYSNGTNPLIGVYHKICRGEVALTNFVRAFLGLPSSMEYNPNGPSTRKVGDALAASKCRLDKIGNYFKGDFSEIEEAINLMPNNEVKVLFGIRATEDGRLRQDINSEVFMNTKQNSTKHIEKVINDAKAAGRYANTEYEFTTIHEYNPQPTVVETNDAPFAVPASSSELPWD